MRAREAVSPTDVCPVDEVAPAAAAADDEPGVVEGGHEEAIMDDAGGDRSDHFVLPTNPLRQR